MLWTWHPTSAATLLHREHQLLESHWLALKTAAHQSADMPLIHEGVVVQLMFLRGHFRSEEQFMQQIKYPAYEEHRAAHEVFINAIGKFLVDLPAASEDWPATVARLHAWITRHNRQHDRTLSRFVAHLDSLDQADDLKSKQVQ
jgi:hemerythrin